LKEFHPSVAGRLLVFTMNVCCLFPRQLHS
jgi:hypothetical protein